MDNSYLFADIWRQIFEWFDMILDSFSSLSSFITSPLADLTSTIDNPSISSLVDYLLQIFPLADFTLLEFMFGSLLPFILLVAFVKYFLDIFL